MTKSKKQVVPKKRGGPRAGAGAARKPEDELKKAITIYVKKSSIERHGGESVLKEILTTFAESPHVVLARAELPAISSPSPKQPIKAPPVIDAEDDEMPDWEKQLILLRQSKNKKK